MARATKVIGLKRLLGQKVVFNGKFEYGEQDRLKDQAEAKQALIADDLDASVNYLVLADLTAGKTIQKKVVSLNAKGAAIQVTDAAAFKAVVEPTEDEMLQLIRGGTANAGSFAKAVGVGIHHRYGQPNPPVLTVCGEKFDGVDLSGFDFNLIAFDRCSFVGCILSNTHFSSATGCDFTKATGESPGFGNCEQTRFCQARFLIPQFSEQLTGADFTSAQFDGATFVGDIWGYRRGQQQTAVNINFASSILPRAKFQGLACKAINFDKADLTGATLAACRFTAASFREATLAGAVLIDCALPQADFSGAKLTGLNLSDSDVTGAAVAGADLADSNLRGAKLDDVDLSKAKNYDPNAMTGGAVGPSLTELDSLAASARRISVTFRVTAKEGEEGDEVGLDSRYLRYGSGLRLPGTLNVGHVHHRTAASFSTAMLQLANLLGNRRVRYETVEAESTKSSKTGKELRDLLMNGIAEAFAQPLPAAAELAAATKAFREQAKEQSAADRERREAAKKLADKQKQTQKKQIAKKIAKEVGKVTDISTFLKALELRNKQKIDKATKMLKASGFQLFNDVTDSHLNGVVKSQTDPDLVYACRIESDGQYACCTQNLNICGGLRGSICKHLLVLIIGLVKAGELDPTTIDGWVAKTHDTKPELDKEVMGEIFIRYKGAEAGEVDWRPTETLPEDYYAV